MIGAAVLFLIFGYPYLQDRRENELVKRLEKLHDAGLAGIEIDAAVAQSRRDTQDLSRFRDHGGI